ncbi:hypothetical protein [Portibacter marinus]|uniref:hypothetical protein n=1 Tax=Portibacter marinus TaxID=2898660 RepID=UPI001F2BA5EF|nr:hypothetical protein [Portibacter marinus]
MKENEGNRSYRPSAELRTKICPDLDNEDFQVMTIKGVTHNFILQNKDGSFKYVDGYWDKMAEWLKERGFTKAK